MNAKPDRHIQVISLGQMKYKEAWDYQEDLFNKTIEIKLRNRELDPSEQSNTPNYLIFCEHPHVYTLGKSGQEKNLLLDSEELEKKHASFFKINRGGDITYHGPGQLVCYPIIDLENFFEDIHKYLRFLEQAVIDTLKEYSILGGRIKGLTGVWIDSEASLNGTKEVLLPRKICAMGVRTSRWVTMHGLALNVNPDLSYFDNIIPCGIDDKAVTSMAKELSHEVSIKEVEKLLTEQIQNQFKMI